MKNKTLKGVLPAGIIILMFACNAKKEEPAEVVVDKEQIKKEIQAKEDEFAAVYNSKELKNIGYYADDATVFAQNREPLLGKEKIIAYLQEGITSSPEGNNISFVTNEVFVSNDGNQVVETGYFKLADSTNAIINSGSYMVLFEKRNGAYVSVREMSTSHIPLE